MIYQYESVTVACDINEVIKEGMNGLVMELTDSYAGVMFTSCTGQTLVYDDETVFMIPLNLLGSVAVA